MREKIFPHVDEERPTIMLLLDNLRFDQWRILKPIISELYRQEEEDFITVFCPPPPNIAGMPYLPDWCRQTLRNIIRIYGSMIMRKEEKQLWGSVACKADRQNCQEGDQVWLPEGYQCTQGKAIGDNILNYLHNDLTVIVYNFIDMLSHARTEMEVLKELAGMKKPIGLSRGPGFEFTLVDRPSKSRWARGSSYYHHRSRNDPGEQCFQGGWGSRDHHQPQV